MYESFYQLAANPFRLAPDPNFCFSHSGYKRAREYLEYVLEQGEGFVMVTGRPGTGKTMLAETFLDEINVNQVTAKRITASNYSADDLLRSVAYAYGIDASNIDLATLRHQIQRYLLSQEQVGRRVLLIIDEAQALQHSALEELRILADLQSKSRLMLQLFLIGQESLQDLMRTPEMEQFQQRVIANYHLEPLNLIDTKAYIEFRLIAAGWNGDPDFTGPAVHSIYQLSRGVPRHINKICNRLLLLGYGKSAHTIDVTDVSAISMEMRDELLAPMGSADSPATAPEPRDDQEPMDDLAISSENLGERLSTISEAARLAAQRQQQLEARHRDGLISQGLQRSDAAAPLHQPDAVVHEPAHPAITPEAAIQMKDRALLSDVLGIFKWREALMVVAATLALTTISIAALPTILGEGIYQGKLSHTENTQPLVPAAAPVEIARAPEAQAITVVPGRQQAEQLALVTVPDLRPSLDVSVGKLPLYDGDEEEPDAESALPEIESAAETAAKPTDEVEVPESERETRTALGDMHRQQQDSVQWSEAGPANQAAVVSVSPVPEAGALDAHVEELLLKGWRSVDDYRLMTPSGNNAYGYFNAVLALDPGNPSAHKGIQRIVDLYATLSRKAMNRRQTDRAGRYVDRGLSIQPDNRELLALQSSLAALAVARPVVSVPPPEREVPVIKGSVTAAERDTQDDMVSRITSFFKKRRAEAERGVVITPAGWDG